MTADNRSRVREIFAQALDRSVEERDEFVHDQCGSDTGLLAQVKALLMALDNAGDFLGSPTEATAASSGVSVAATATSPFEGPGVRIGNYKLLQLIGEGGFGSVFMAEQQQPVVRKVALKIIKLGMDTKHVIARFEAERQALALMDHPNIARVFDAGATETGRPYFVMELVKGVPITEYCDRNSLSIRDRLELFAQVCQAVQHAHQKGIIHRDLKPSNVLVVLQDGRPFAKVIDFGIAKATSARLTEKTLFTEFRQFIGTPEYMSPEQAEGTMDIDTRTDVYSLGVLLYELLTGATPFDSRSLRSAAFNEIQRIIREVEPPNPSTRLSQNTDTIASVAASRRTEPRKLGTIIRGELDWIVMKALEKDRKRRYETASELRLDVQRFLDGAAVTAAPPGVRYRVSKFVRRNKGPVAAASAVAMALFIGVIAFAWQAKIARDQRDIAVKAKIAEGEQRTLAEDERNIARAQRNIATQEAARAKAMNSFMQQMFIAANPETADGSRDITVIELLNSASAKASRTLKDQPMVEAAARTLLGNTFRSLGRMNEARTELERALELRMTGPEAGTFSQAETLRAMGVMLEAIGDRKAALTHFERAQEIALKSGEEHRKHAVTGYLDLARIHLNLSQFPESEQAINSAEELARRLPDMPVAAQADILASRASLLSYWKDDWAGAESLNEQALALWRQTGEPYAIADAINNVAVVKMTLNKLDEAIVLYREAIDIMRSEFGENNQRTAMLTENLANVYFRQKEYAKSLEMLQDVSRIREAIFGADSMPAARTRLNMGSIALNTQDFQKALECADAAIPVFRRNLGDQHLDVAQALRNRGSALKGLGDLEGAMREFQTALEIFDVAPNPVHAGRLRLLLLIAETQCLQGKPDDARRTADTALSALNAENPDQAKWIRNFEDQIAKCGQSPAP